MSVIRGEEWDWVFLIPITFMLIGILLPFIAGVRIVNGGGLGWLTVALCYLGLQVPGSLSAPFYFIYNRVPLNLPGVLLILMVYLFVCVWFYTLRVTILARRSGCGSLY